MDFSLKAKEDHFPPLVWENSSEDLQAAFDQMLLDYIGYSRGLDLAEPVSNGTLGAAGGPFPV